MTLASSSLAFAGDVYECSSTATILHHRVAWPQIEIFSREIRKFERLLEESAQEEYWETFFRPLRRYLFLLLSTPLATNDPAICIADLTARLQFHLRHVKHLYLDYASGANNLLALLAELVSSGDNHLVNQIAALLREQQNETTALVLKETKFLAPVERVLRLTPTLAGVKVMGAHHLSGDYCFQNIIMLGAPSWYPEYLFSAPRAYEIHIINCFKGRRSWKMEAAFLGSHPFEGPDNSALGHVGDVEESMQEDGLIAEDLLPQINLDVISERLARSSEAGREYELVEARLFTLEGGASVFIDATDGAKALVIDPDGIKGQKGHASRLRRILVSYVDPGTYLLLRTCGGGDYIIPVADRILGNNATHIRAGQQHWKNLLREQVKQKGLLQTSIELLDYGSVRAEEINVRNWMSSRNIRPNDKRDFEAILKLIGLEDRINEYWRNAKALTTAHMSAGRHIRRLLLREVENADLNELERIGRMDFILPGEDAGSLTAFRVLGASTKKYKIPVSHLEEPFESEADLWLE